MVRSVAERIEADDVAGVGLRPSACIRSMSSMAYSLTMSAPYELCSVFSSALASVTVQVG